MKPGEALAALAAALSIVGCDSSSTGGSGSGNLSVLLEAEGGGVPLDDVQISLQTVPGRGAGVSVTVGF